MTTEKKVLFNRPVRRQSRIVAWSFVAAVLFPLLSLYAAPSEGPTLTEALSDQLLNLPYGLAGQRGLIVRLKHVDSVQFYGAGADSKFSFVRGHAVIPGGLSLRLKNTGSFSWASGTIRLKTPLNVTRYNSVVVWVRTTHPGLRFWIGVQDPHWSESDRAQARTDILPFRGFPTGQPVQLVIPFAAIYPDQPMDYTRLSQLAFEFGQDTVGNDIGGEIEILGIAFVHQDKIMRRVRIVTDQALVRADGIPRRGRRLPGERRGVMAFDPAKPGDETDEATAPADAAADMSVDSGAETATDTAAADAASTVETRLAHEPVAPAPAAAQEIQPEPLKQARPADRAGQTAAALLSLTHSQTRNFLNSLRARLSHSPDGTRTAARASGAVPAKAAFPAADPAAAAPSNVSFRLPAIAAGGAGLAVFACAVWVLTRRRNAHRLRQLPKIFHAIHWPFTITESTSLARFQRDFWKGLAAERVKVGWLSVTGNTVDKTSDEEFYGARFLERQVRMASEAGVRVFPSLSFVKTVFHYESFLANPKLYHVKPVDDGDRELTDAEIRAKEKHAFPVWVPSFWQNKYNLPYRVLVEFGKVPGIPVAKNIVQYNLNAPELRAMAIRTISRFAEVSPGVRIEDAVMLLSSRQAPKTRTRKDGASARITAPAKISIPAKNGANGAGQNGHAKDAEKDPPTVLAIGAAEFWSEVIAAVRLRYPEFLFVAGPAGADAAALRAFGFDYVENDGVVETLTDQVQAGSTGPVERVLTANADVLKDSIYDVSNLIRPSPSTEVVQRQNLLTTILLALLPGVLQHDDNLPDDVTTFIQRISRSTVLRKGHFVSLPSNSGNVVAFARWRRRALFVAVANFSSVAQEAAVRLDPIADGLDENKLYLFNNAVHGTEQLRNVINTGNGGPALALWGQSLRDAGVNIRLPGLSLKLFSVNLTRPIPTASAKEEAEALTTLAR